MDLKVIQRMLGTMETNPVFECGYSSLNAWNCMEFISTYSDYLYAYLVNALVIER
jgi:hypothetical protein